jgi:hypothetical protein
MNKNVFQIELQMNKILFIKFGKIVITTGTEMVAGCGPSHFLVDLMRLKMRLGMIGFNKG